LCRFVGCLLHPGEAMAAWLLALLASSGLAGKVDPKYALDLTVYHVHPANVSSVPVDMDTGDLYGDLFFFLDEFLLPLQCADPSYFFDKFECQNPEHRKGDLVATQVHLQVDSRFGNYAGCNLCTGIDPFTRKPCKKGTYICDCMNFTNPTACDHHFVGRETVQKQFVHNVSKACEVALEESCHPYRTSQFRCPRCLFQHRQRIMESCDKATAMSYCPGFAFPLCTSDSKDYDCWHMNIARKTSGAWYSTFREGLCDKSPGHCSWEVKKVKTIPERCLRDRMVTTVEEAGPECFDRCGTRNESSHCWVSCFFGTVLGPESHNSTNVTGIDREILAASWSKAFEEEAEGGCRLFTDPLDQSIVV